jgi:TetR/AcrR family transcriptional regulator, transcriptional repressor for nem operon
MEEQGTSPMVRDHRTRSAETVSGILDIAERLVQRRGFNGFSYADIASEFGITRASLHYHFAGKAQLGESLITRYSSRFAEALRGIDAGNVAAADKLRAYCDIYRTVLSGRRMCLCGILAAEYDTLPDPMRKAVVAFFDQNQAWLSGFLEHSRAAGDLYFAGTSNEAARSIIASLEGAILVSRPYGDTVLLDSVAERIVGDFCTDEQKK